MAEDTEFLQLRQLFTDLPEMLNFQQIRELREKVGELMLRSSPENYSVYRTVYDDFTQKLKARAEDLGQAAEFAEAERLTQLVNQSQDVFDKMQKTNSGLEYFDILNDPTKQNEIAALQSLVERELGKDYITKDRDSHKATYRIAASDRAGEKFRYRDLFGFAIEWVRDKIKETVRGNQK